MTSTAIALRLAALAPTHPDARAALPRAVDMAHAELVAAGSPEAAERVVAACCRLANRPGHLSANTCPIMDE